MATCPRSESGSVALETAVVAPGLLLIITLLVLGGRITLVSGSVEHAAAEAARAASIARTQSEAVADGKATAERSLSQQDLNCVGGPSTLINAAQFSSSPGQVATVWATVTCQVPLSDLLLPGLPGSRTITETVVSPLDTYRMRR